MYQEGVHGDSVETLLCRWFVDMRCSFGRRAFARRLFPSHHDVTKGNDATPKLLTSSQVSTVPFLTTLFLSSLKMWKVHWHINSMLAEWREGC